jgi:acyl-coenzyme A synthetase/AMP-(fatty) acid ligase
MNVTLALHEHARRQPTKPALIAERETLTYRQLDDLLWRGAGYFRSAGLEAGDRVALRIAHPLLNIVAGLALARLGVAFASVAPGESPAVIEALVRRIGARALISQPERPGVNGIAQIALTHAAFSGGGNEPRGAMCEDPDQIWHYVTGSGTTGKPKLFAMKHGRMLRYLHAFQLGEPSSPDDVVLALPRPHFFMGILHNLQAVTSGATAVVPEALAPESLVDVMTGCEVNRLFAMPSSLLSLLNWPGHERALIRLSVVATGGYAISRSLRERMLAFTPGLLVIYGANEIGFLASTQRIRDVGIADSVGHAVPYGELEIVDAAGRSLPAGQVGEIRGRRDSMTEGYLEDPAANEQYFRDGWFHPGDLGCWTEDRQLIFKGRTDDMMIYDGVNIFPIEIESCLQEHPGVIEAIAFPLPSDRYGAIPAAAVRVHGAVAEAELIRFVKQRLGTRHPRRLTIVDDFPRNAVGKPMRRVMAERLQPR